MCKEKELKAQKYICYSGKGQIKFPESAHQPTPTKAAAVILSDSDKKKQAFSESNSSHVFSEPDFPEPFTNYN